MANFGEFKNFKFFGVPLRFSMSTERLTELLRANCRESPWVVSSISELSRLGCCPRCFLKCLALPLEMLSKQSEEVCVCVCVVNSQQLDPYVSLRDDMLISTSFDGLIVSQESSVGNGGCGVTLESCRNAMHFMSGITGGSVSGGSGDDVEARTFQL
jgi:hypothetical protein